MFGLKDPKNPEAEMGFFDHVEALRGHLIRSIIAIAVCASFVGIFYDFVFDKIILGIQSKNFPTYRLMCFVNGLFVKYIHWDPGICIDHDMPIPLQNTAMFGQVTLLFQYSIIIGIIMAFPYVIWELWRFVAPALKEEEARKRAALSWPAQFSFSSASCFAILLSYPSPSISPSTLPSAQAFTTTLPLKIILIFLR